MIAAIHLSDEHTPQPIPPVDDDDDDDDDKSKPGSGGGNIDPDDDEGDDDDDEDDEDETLWTASWRQPSRELSDCDLQRFSTAALARDRGIGDA